MVAQDGTRSSEWLSPSHPDVRIHLQKIVAKIIQIYDVDGIHLDYIRYPSMSYDFAPYSVQTFKKATGLSEEVTNDELMSRYYNQWMQWRIREITNLTQALKDEVLRIGGKDIIFSAALIANAAKSYRSMENYGQDYAQLADHLDVIIPMAYFKEEARPPHWISDIHLAARIRVGTKPLLMGLSAYKKPGGWDYTEKEWAEALEVSNKGPQGVVVYPYMYLFGRGNSAWNAPQGSAALFKEMIKSNIGLANTNIFYFILEKTRQDYFYHLLLGVSGIMVMVFFVYLRRKRSHKDIKNISYYDVKPSMGWQELDRYIQEKNITGEIFEQVMLTMRQFNYQRIEKYRLAFILDILQNYPDPLSALLNGALNQIPDWKVIGFRYLEEARLLGYVHVYDTSASITEEGIKEFQSICDDGYSKDLWIFVEKRLHENVLISCSSCCTKNLSQWYWPTFKCIKCKKEIFVKKCNDVFVTTENNSLKSFTPSHHRALSI
jgi:hypothetical protein